MPDKNKMNAEMKIRCYLEEKGLLKKQADEAGLSMSDFIRSLIFNEEKLVILSDGAEIAKALFLVHNDFEYYRFNGGITEEAAEIITEALSDVSAQLNSVAAKLTDIHADKEEEEENE